MRVRERCPEGILGIAIIEWWKMGIAIIEWWKTALTPPGR
jgi:hypothetical protein